MKILAGIVLYNPEMNRLKENIAAVIDQVDSVLLIDNNSTEHNDILLCISDFKNVVMIKNNNNNGIAAALNQIMNYAVDNDFDWVLTLDQDSVCESELIKNYLNYVHEPNVGMMTCEIVDRNFKEQFTWNESEKFRVISLCITSGAFMSVAAFAKTEGFDEKMFIDSVDFDMCYQLDNAGYKIIKINYKGLLHEVGKGRNVKLFFKPYIVFNHNSKRHYFMARNHIYLAYKYPKKISLFKEYIREFIACVLIVMYEKDKLVKLKARFEGFRDVKKMFE